MVCFSELLDYAADKLQISRKAICVRVVFVEMNGEVLVLERVDFLVVEAMEQRTLCLIGWLKF